MGVTWGEKKGGETLKIRWVTGTRINIWIFVFDNWCRGGVFPGVTLVSWGIAGQ